MKNLGRFKYKQRKSDFQLQEDLTGNLRQMKPLGNDMLVEDRFDSIFRRNLVEPDAPTNAEKLRQKKLKYKWRGAVGEKTQELNKSNLELKARNDRREKGMNQMVNDDVIVL